MQTVNVATREAERVASEAAARAGVHITEVSEPRRAVELATLFMTVWRTDFQHAPVSPELLCALASTGQYVVTARRNGALVGGSVGFRMDDDGEPRLHSHITAVAPAAQGHQVGFALKLHQRAWALVRGLTGINWTFDPLVRRNAYFNLTKLRATADRYRVNAYGEMPDGINAGGESDRYVAEWPVCGPARAPIEPNLDGVEIVLADGADGSPQPAEPRSATAPRRAWIPEDIVAMRASAPELALRWRLALRTALLGAMRDGFAATAMTRDGWYLLERRR